MLHVWLNGRVLLSIAWKVYVLYEITCLTIFLFGVLVHSWISKLSLRYAKIIWVRYVLPIWVNAEYTKILVWISVFGGGVEVRVSLRTRVYWDPCLGYQSSVAVLVILHKRIYWDLFDISLRCRFRRAWIFTNKKAHSVVALIIGFDPILGIFFYFLYKF